MATTDKFRTICCLFLNVCFVPDFFSILQFSNEMDIPESTCLFGIHDIWATWAVQQHLLQHFSMTLRNNSLLGTNNGEDKRWSPTPWSTLWRTLNGVPLKSCIGQIKTLYQHGEQPLRWTYLADVIPWTGWLLRAILKDFHRTLFQVLFYKPPWVQVTPCLIWLPSACRSQIPLNLEVHLENAHHSLPEMETSSFPGNPLSQASSIPLYRSSRVCKAPDRLIETMQISVW